MDGLNLILLGVFMFTLIVLILVTVILFAKARLVTSGSATVLINDDPDKAIEVGIGAKLMNALADQKIFVPSACGGGGTCGQC